MRVLGTPPAAAIGRVRAPGRAPRPMPATTSPDRAHHATGYRDEAATGPADRTTPAPADDRGTTARRTTGTATDTYTDTYTDTPRGACPRTKGTTVVGQRGARRRAPQQDLFKDALTTVVAEALDVDVDRLEVTVRLDGAAVDVGRVPATLTLAESLAVGAPAVPAADADEDRVEDEDRDEPVAEPARAGRSATRGEARSEARSETRSDARDGAEPAPISAEDLDAEAEAAADLMEGLLDALDLPGDLRISVQEAHAEVEVIGLGEGVLIGRRGQTLDAVQELVRTAMQRRFERRSRVLIDVDGYRARRMEKLLERAEEAVQEVLDSGEPQRLEPMDAIERRLVHQAVAAHEGVTSHSHGREPARRIVIELADDED